MMYTTEGEHFATQYCAVNKPRSHLEAEVFFGVIIANILYNLTKRFKLACGILTAFHKIAEHIA